MFGVGGFWVVSWAEAEERIHQMLPLAVGNSWVYDHFLPDSGDVTISITHTEDIEGHTYHVFSDMPYEDPPVPYFFIAGKKVRWEGDHLLFRQQDRDVAFFRFNHSVFENPEGYEWWKPAEEVEYDYVIPKTETETDTLVTVWPTWTQFDAFLQGVPRIGGCLQLDNRFVLLFYFSNNYPNTWTGEAGFIEGFGMSLSAAELRDDRGRVIGGNALAARYAFINGERFDFWRDPRGKILDHRDESPCIRETAIRKLPWGVLKQEFLHLFKPGGLE